MVLSARRAWLVAYDITDRRRLIRLHRFLRKLAQPVQYSVFYYEGSAAQVGRLARDIEKQIDTRSDDVRIYQLPERIECITLGRGSMPTETWLFSERVGLARLTRPASA
jgi:CRISPR-associated protein Cas2